MYPGIDSSDLCNYISAAQARQEVDRHTVRRHGGWRRRSTGFNGWRMRLGKSLVKFGLWLQRPSLLPARPVKHRNLTAPQP